MRYVAFFALIVVLCTPFVCSAQVLINELLADPARDWDGDGSVGSKNDEWVEIVNVGNDAVDLSHYRLGDASGGYDWRYGFSGTLAAGAVRVVYGSEAVAWQSDNGYPSFGLSLNNGGDTVFLHEATDSDTTVVDSYTYQSFEVADDRAVGRSPDGSPVWALFDILNPYSGTTPPLGTGCDPTPGLPNNCTSTLPVEHSTWGAIKEMYRN